MPQMLMKGGKGILTAIVVSVLEEAIFRGVLYGRLASRWGHWIAAMSSSLVYAVVHFIAPDKNFVYPGWSPTVGFEYMGVIVGRLASDGVLQGIFGLFLVGLVLCEAYRRARSLWLSIGLHAGWVFALKASLFLAFVPAGMNFAEGLGRRYSFVAEPVTWVCVVLVWFAVWRIEWRKPV
jgi:membrane protease YdiL (CAAX protease family)